MMFLSVCVNSVGALTAYMTGSGKLLHSLFGISPALGSVLFFVPAAGVLYLGLKAIGRGEKFISIGMVVMISVLVIATLLKETTRRRLSARRQLAVYGSGLQRRGILLLGTVYRAGDGAGLRRQTGKIA